MRGKKHTVTLCISLESIVVLAILTATLSAASTSAYAQTETALHSFSAPLGPGGLTGSQGEVIFDAAGNLYGTTEGGEHRERSDL
jgi:hypothetical protein